MRKQKDIAMETGLAHPQVLNAERFADSELSEASWALARVHAPPALQARWQRRRLAPPQQQQPAAAAASSGSAAAGAAAAAAAEAAEAVEVAEAEELQPGVAELMDAIASRARSHLMNRHSARGTFAPRCCTGCPRFFPPPSPCSSLLATP